VLCFVVLLTTGTIVVECGHCGPYKRKHQSSNVFIREQITGSWLAVLIILFPETEQVYEGGMLFEWRDSSDWMVQISDIFTYVTVNLHFIL